MPEDRVPLRVLRVLTRANVGGHGRTKISTEAMQAHGDTPMMPRCTCT